MARGGAGLDWSSRAACAAEKYTGTDPRAGESLLRGAHENPTRAGCPKGQQVNDSSRLSEKPARKRPRLPLPPPPSGLSDDALLTIREVAAWRRTGVSTAWRDVRSGLLPPPIYITPKSPRWRFRAIRAAEGAA